MGYIENMGPKIDYLVPRAIYRLDPPYDTYESITWQDSRTMPTEAALLAIAQAQLDLAAQDVEVASVDSLLTNDKMQRLLFEIHYDMENRMRIREGRATVTKLQYKNAILELYRTL